MSNKLREALEFIKLASDDWETYANTIGGALDVIYEKACLALAEPLRNCEIGTAEEQADRFFNFCNGYMSNTNYKSCGTCPLWTSGAIGEDCELRWAQLPYKKEGEVSNG